MEDAIERNDMDTLRQLVENGADVNESISGDSPLFVAVVLDRKNMVKYLLENGATLEKGLFDEPIRRDNLEMIQILQPYDPKLQSLDHDRAIDIVIRKNHVELARYLFQNGIDINARNRRGYTRLHNAIQMDDMDSVKFLVSQGADLDKLSDDKTPLQAAEGSENYDIIKYLLENGADPVFQRPYDLIFDLVTNGQMDMAEFLVQRRPNRMSINTTDSTGRTLLTAAVKTGSIELVKFLITHGADVNSEDNLGWIPLMLAFGRNQFEIMKYLIEAGADLSVLNIIRTLEILSTFNQLDLAAMVLSRINIEQKDSDNRTLLYRVVDQGLFDVTKLLVSNGAKVDVIYNDVTPLEVAMFNDDFDIALHLVQNGANIHRKKDDGKTLFYYGLLTTPEIIQFLIANGLPLQNNEDVRLFYKQFGEEWELNAVAKTRNNITFYDNELSVLYLNTIESNPSIGSKAFVPHLIYYSLVRKG